MSHARWQAVQAHSDAVEDCNVLHYDMLQRVALQHATAALQQRLCKGRCAEALLAPPIRTVILTPHATCNTHHKHARRSVRAFARAWT
jgi:hypothetical protein